jgi:hypothetical protein
MARSASDPFTMFVAVASPSSATKLYVYDVSSDTFFDQGVDAVSIWSGLGAVTYQDSRYLFNQPSYGIFEAPPVSPPPNGSNPIASFVSDGVPFSNSWFVLAVDTAGNLYQDGSQCFPGPCMAGQTPLFKH